MNEKIGKKNLLEVKKILDDAKITFWLDTGTLLGIVRDGHLIPWDHDIDITIFEKDKKKLESLMKIFRKNKFEVFRQFDGFHIKKRGCFISVVYFQIEGKHAIRYLSIDNNKYRTLYYLEKALMIPNYCDLLTRKQSLIKKIISGLTAFLSKLIPYFIRRPIVEQSIKFRLSKCKILKIKEEAKYFKKFNKIKYGGEFFRIPYDYKNYLEKIYGKNWKVPNKEWVWHKDYDKVADAIKKHKK